MKHIRSNHNRYIHGPAWTIRRSLFLLGTFFIGSLGLHAQNVDVWSGAGALSNGDWYSTDNWVNGNVPMTNLDLAEFDDVAPGNWTGTGSLNENITIYGMIFGGSTSYNIDIGTNSGDSSFTFDGSQSATVGGTPGVVNNSGVGQYFAVSANIGYTSTLAFTGGADGGDVKVGYDIGPNGVMTFTDSNADAATIYVEGGPFPDSQGGEAGGQLAFYGAGDAGTAAIKNYTGQSNQVNQGPDSNNYASGGTTDFYNSSSADAATLTNQGGTVTLEPASETGNGNIEFVGFSQGITTFHDMSSAGGVTIVNDSGTEADANGGTTMFEDHSDAAHAFITNNGGLDTSYYGGELEFYGQSTADAATITNDAGLKPGARGGRTYFTDGSSAELSAIENVGSDDPTAGGGATVFASSSTAGLANIFNDGGIADSNTSIGALGGTTTFQDYSTSFESKIDNLGGEAGYFYDSTKAQNVALYGLGGVTTFQDHSTAGDSDTTIDNQGGEGIFDSTTGTMIGAAGPGMTVFEGNADAGSAQIENHAGSYGGLGGEIDFHDMSSANSATITNDGGGFGYAQDTNNSFVQGPGTGGMIIFHDSSTAGGADIINNASSYTGATSGEVEFLDSSTAGSAFLINEDANANEVAGQIYFENTSNAGSAIIGNGGTTTFEDSADAGTASIQNGGGNTGFINGGVTYFTGQSTADNAFIQNQRGTASGTAGGIIHFEGSATAGAATILNNGSNEATDGAGSTIFDTSSTAGSAEITNSGGAAVAEDSYGSQAGLTYFEGSSSAASAAILNEAGGIRNFTDPSTQAQSIQYGQGGETIFENSATAGAAVIENQGGVEIYDPNQGGAAGTSGNGETVFSDSSTAGGAQITNDAGNRNAFAGETIFDSYSTAGTATITSQGGSLMEMTGTDGQIYDQSGTGGVTVFTDSASADQATIIDEAGFDPDTGGQTYFEGSADGGTASLDIAENAFADISQLTTSGLGIGSISGQGTIYLGSKTLTVGLNNANTEFSGSIEDNGVAGGSGGSLAKAGTGTLTLSGLNYFSGPVAIVSGTVSINTVNTGTNAQSLGTGTDVYLGLANNSSGTLDYTGTGGTLDKNITARGTGADMVQNTGSGVLTLSGTLTKDGTTLTLDGGAGGINVTGQIVGASPHSDLDVTGLVTLDNSSNSYTGPTVIEALGTLVLAASHVIPTPTDVTLEGGKLVFSGTGIDESGLGTFTLTGGSTIDFGSGGNELSFASIDGDLASGLTVDNWTAGDTLDITGLTSQDAADIHFYSDDGQTSIGNGTVSEDGSITPTETPEPSTWALCTAGLLALGCCKRRAVVVSR